MIKLERRMSRIDGNGDWSDCGYSGQKVMFVSFPDSFETWQPREREKAKQTNNFFVYLC